MASNKKHVKALWQIAGIFFALFFIILIGVKFIDVKAIGPQNSSIGLSALNGFFQKLIGQHMLWYQITKITGILTILTAGGFALLGLRQLIQRKSLQKVDRDIMVLGGFYALIIAIYVFFEVVVINYRPVILETELEASFPSSHSMLAVFIMNTAAYQFAKRLADRPYKKTAVNMSLLIGAVTVIGRLLSGVHWFTDILAGTFLSLGLVFAYIAICKSR